MSIAARVCEVREIEPLREKYVKEMNCQVVYDSIHTRPGWTQEYALEADGVCAGYGSMAVGGPWLETHSIYEFYVQPERRTQAFQLFDSFATACAAKRIEMQSNARLLSVMLHTFAANIRGVAIVFEAGIDTSLKPSGAGFRATTPQDAEELVRAELDQNAKWVVTRNGEIAGEGGILYHYNPPFGDIYMNVAPRFRRRGLGAFLVQELKAVCRAEGTIPAARCSVDNVASRKTLQRAGMVPYSNLLVGDLGPASECP